MATAGGRVLSKMLDRLLAGLMSGPNMNCRPHKSRQRIDLTQLARLADVPVEDLLRGVLGTERCAKALARVKMPRKLMNSAASTEDQVADGTKPPGEKAWIEQSALLNKLRVIADDARTYENDTGVHALSIGFPLLSLPPGSFGGGSRTGTKRILAPIAFVPVTLALKGGAAPSVEIACHSDGADRVRANPALLSWIEQQTGKPADLFEDEDGTDPWREITQLVRHVASAINVDVPEVFKASSFSGCSEGAPAVHERAAEPIGPGHSEADPTKIEDSQPNCFEIPATFALQPSPLADEDDEHPTIVIAAVLGLFPTAHQGLVRDTREMIAESSTGTVLTGPIQSFLAAAIDFDAPVSQAVTTPTVAIDRRLRSQASERLAAVADPCQSKAVALARVSDALVVHGPPGTGKSQTITNIIADCLSRGQRVLLVCEKRTALDVVADRLEHMGLGSFCGIVHDPQRDQRDLYRAIRQQLDDLPDAKMHPKAEAALSKVDIELQQLHDELTGFHRSLMKPFALGGSSFHELMGQWLSIVPDKEVLLDDAATSHVSVEVFQNQRATLLDLFRRAGSVDFSRNLWSRCAGISLADFLARPMSSVRVSMERSATAATRADETATSNIPPFSHKAPLQMQGSTREETAGRLKSLLPAVHAAGLIDWAGQDELHIRAALGRLAALNSSVKVFISAPLDSLKTETVNDSISQVKPLDPELRKLASPLPPALQIAQQAMALQAYLDVAGKWTAMFAFGIKKEAAKVLKLYALPLSASDAARLQMFLAGVQARLVLTAERDELIGIQARDTLVRAVSAAQGLANPNTSKLTTDLAGQNQITADGQIASDGSLAQMLDVVTPWFNLLLQLREDPAADGLSALLAAAVKTEEATDDFIDGLLRSSARADALIRLEEELSKSALFERQWLADLHEQLRQGKLAGDTATALVGQLDSLEGVLRVRAGQATIPATLQPAVEVLLSQVVDADSAMAALQKSIVAHEIGERLRSDPLLHGIDAHHVESAFGRYRELNSQKKSLVRDFIANQWIAKQKERLLAVTGTRLNASGADLRRRLTTRGERAMRLRQVIANGESIDGGDPLFDLCPIWMASPETVAQVFPRKAMFDVVVFDEASQCRLEEALPVLTRGRRVVIAGDPNQLPPTRFFESGLVQSEEEDPETEQELFEAQLGEIEDLLAASLNLAIQQCYLDVHYRSRNADLIEFSNRNFYGRRLQAIPGHPANRSRFSPLTLYRVDGVYNKRQNEAEADRVVAIVKDLLKRSTPPSIGIACLNLPQRDLIVEKLDDLAIEDADFGKRLAAARIRKGAGSSEGLFVKNLENVQGDERDDIIISTTYGPDASGKFYRRFGPLGVAGGGRRLNVLVTRARNEVHLVTSIPIEAYRTLPIVPEGQTATGAWLLFAYLKYAEELAVSYERAETERSSASLQHSTADMDGTAGSDEHAFDSSAVIVHPGQSPSLFSRQLAELLASGHQVGSDVHWGNEGFCVDLAIHHPVRPGDVTIGVLCDGCRYPAADDPVEWDIFRTGVLEDQGWTLRRVWSSHYFRDPEGNVKEIIAAAAKFVAGEKPIETIATE